MRCVGFLKALRASTNLRTLHTYSTKTDVGGSTTHEQMLKQFRLLKQTKYSEMFQKLSKLSNASIFKPNSELFKRKFTNSIRDRSVTLMLLAIVGIFLGCNGLAFCNNIVEILIIANHQMTNNGMELFEKSVEISNILITLNCSTSTIVYFSFSSKYRNLVKVLFGLEQRKRMNRIAITTAVACHRTFELSLIPDEAETRNRKAKPMPQISEDRISLRSPNAAQRRILFRSQTSSMSKTLASSESNLRLMDNQESDKSLNVPPR
uniref:Uncharacterized protein n=1 Tax=Panagrolaimus sp. ES5 TaxID=591445 RepID=A0AC34F502_9BILA